MTPDTNSSALGADETQDLALAIDVQEGVRRGQAPAGRAWLRRALEVGVSLLCLFLAVRTVHPADLWQALRQADLLWVLGFVVIMAGVLILKAWRWQLLFYPEYRLPFSSPLSILAISYMVSNLLPGRVGELARVILLPAEQPVSPARTVATIVVERLLDLLTVLLILVLLLPFVSLPADMLHGAQALGVMALLGAIALIVLSFWKDRLLGWAHLLLRRIRFLDRAPVYAALGHLLDGFALLRTPLGLAVIALAITSWVAVVGLAWAAAHAFHLTVPLTALVFAVVLTSLSQLLPSTPGYIGVFQLAAKLAVVPLGVAAAQAEIFGFGWWGLTYITLTGGGLIAMWVHGVSFRQIMSWRKRGHV